MNQLKHILVGWDFSAGAEAALSQAIRLAKWNESQLTVRHVVDEEVMESLGMNMDRSGTSLAEEASRTARHELEARLAQAGIKAAVSVVVGSPLHELLTAVEAIPADLLLVGTCGSPRPKPTTGTLAAKLMRKAATKVMLVQPGHAGPYRNIVACVDFSETSAEAVAQALRVAGREGGRVHFLHVFEPPWHDLRHRMPSLIYEADFQTQFESAMKKRMRQFVREAGGNPEHSTVLGAEHHSYGIMSFAHQVKADLIVLGTRGRTRLEYVLLGSTAEGLLRELDCSVLSIRAKDAPQAVSVSRATANTLLVPG